MANYLNRILQSNPNQHRKTTIYYQKTTLSLFYLGRKISFHNFQRLPCLDDVRNLLNHREHQEQTHRGQHTTVYASDGRA